MNKIGQIESLGKDRKKELKMLNYAEIDPGDDVPAPVVNKFIELQQRKKKLDEQMNPEKHLLPKEIKNGKKKHEDGFKLPFHSLDVIFNHKGMWANLQNNDPSKIKYHIHK